MNFFIILCFGFVLNSTVKVIKKNVFCSISEHDILLLQQFGGLLSGLPSRNLFIICLYIWGFTHHL